MPIRHDELNRHSGLKKDVLSYSLFYYNYLARVTGIQT